MSQTMSTTTSILRRTVAAASRAPVMGSRMGLPACSNPTSQKFYSTTAEASEPVQLTEKDHKKQSKGEAPPKLFKADGIQLGYTIDTSAAPTLSKMLDERVNPKATDRIHWTNRRALHNVPLAHLPTIESWAKSAESSQSATPIDISSPSCLNLKKKPAKGRYPEMERIVLIAASPTLAALGDSLFAKLKEEVTAENASLKKVVNRESRWALHVALTPQDLKDVPQTFGKLKEEYKEKLGNEKISVTGLWVQKIQDGEKKLTEYPFKA